MRRTRLLAAGVIVVGGIALLASGASGYIDLPGSLSGASQEPTATVSSEPPPASTPAGRTVPPPTSTPSTKPTPKAVLEPGDTGKKVREVQARLKQLEWYQPKVTGAYDKTTEKAVAGFQNKRSFPSTGTVDERTWKRIVKMSRTPTDDELHNRMTAGPTILGPGDSGKQIRELQARLKQIGWFSPDVTDYYGDETTASVEGFQDKRDIPVTGEVDERTMDRLIAMTHEPSKDELYNRSSSDGPTKAALDRRCKTGRVLCIDKTSRTLRWVVDGEVKITVDVRFGSDEMPTREGQFQVNFKSRDHVSSIYNTSMPYAMFFSGGQAVHFSPDFAASGYSGRSHGCVNVRDLSAIKKMFDLVNVGDKVIVYWS